MNKETFYSNGAKFMALWNYKDGIITKEQLSTYFTHEEFQKLKEELEKPKSSEKIMPSFKIDNDQWKE